MPLEVIIVGGGIAGLATAIAFAQHGHQVAVFERRTDQKEDGGSGIQLQPSAVRVLTTWGLKSELATFAHQNGETNLKRYDSGTVIGQTKARKEQWYGLRADFRKMLHNCAIRHGAKIYFGKLVKAVDRSRLGVVFEDESSVEADLLIGADGIRSKVREAIFPNVVVEARPECTFQVMVSRSSMEQTAATKRLYDDPRLQFWMSPGRCVVASAALKRDVYDIQLIDHEYGFEQDARPETWNERIYDLSWLRDRFSDYDPAVQAILAECQSYWKWRLAEIAGLPSWSSEDGKIVLLGDSAHAMVPFVGQGATQGFEDAAVLSELFRQASPQHDFRKLAKLYETVRQPRVEKIQALARSSGVRFALPDGPRQQRRDRKLRQTFHQNGDRTADANANADVPSASPTFEAWLDDYDAIAEAHTALEQSVSSRDTRGSKL